MIRTSADFRSGYFIRARFLPLKMKFSPKFRAKAQSGVKARPAVIRRFRFDKKQAGRLKFCRLHCLRSRKNVSVSFFVRQIISFTTLILQPLSRRAWFPIACLLRKPSFSPLEYGDDAVFDFRFPTADCNPQPLREALL
jgi:hypothetical protein